jgi:large subunit ribosomal protein L1
MAKKSKRIREIAKKVDLDKRYSLQEAIEILKSCPGVKFDQTVEVALMTGVDTKKSDQQVRGTVSLPNGTGKRMVLVVIARSDKHKEALDAGADFVGSDDLIEKIKGGWTDFSAIVATPDMMREVGKLGKVLGPRGLMPTPKAGTVTNDIAKAVQDVKAGKIEYKTDKTGAINSLVGKLSFDSLKLVQNIEALISAIIKSKPSSAKGQYLKGLYLSSTMGPGLKVDLSSITEVQGG